MLFIFYSLIFLNLLYIIKSISGICPFPFSQMAHGICQ